MLDQEVTHASVAAGGTTFDAPEPVSRSLAAVPPMEEASAVGDEVSPVEEEETSILSVPARGKLAGR